VDHRQYTHVRPRDQCQVQGVVVQGLLYALSFSGFCFESKGFRARLRFRESQSARRAPDSIFSTASSLASEHHHGKVTAVSQVIDGQFQRRAGLAFDEHLRAGAGCRPWPMDSRLETRLAAGAMVCEVDFVGCGAPQRHVWPIAVVPRNSQIDFAVNRAAQQRYPRRGPQALLQCPPKAFDDSNAACLADSSR
jgi:hypothetical protein